MSEEKSFSDLFEASQQVNMSMKKGDKVSGEIIDIQKDTIFVDLGGRQDGIVDAKDFTDPEGNLTVKVGDTIEAFVGDSTANGIQLRRQIGGRAIHEVDQAVSEAFQSKMPIEGKVTGERRKGDALVGYAVQIGKSEAFCPASQIDGRGVRRDPSDYIGQTYSFRITEYAEDGYRLVVSRRSVLEEEEEASREKLLANLQVGDTLYGTVDSLQPYGAFVDLGGLSGLVPNRELSWDRGVRPEDVVKVGDRVQVKVIEYLPAEGKNRARITLSLKQASGVSPWEKFVSDPGYAAGTKHKGKVVRLASFGAFIRVAPGVDGLAHISQLGADHRIESPSEVLKEGDEVDVTILDVNEETRRVALCVGDPKVKGEKAAKLTEAEAAQANQITASSSEVLEGEVERQAPYGLFVKLPNGQTGLLHISQIALGGGENAMKERVMFREHPLHSKIKVIVKSVEGDKLSLTTPEKAAADSESSGNSEVKDEGSASFGSLGDLFGGLKL